MTGSAELGGLLERVRMAKGADRGLDCLIAVALDGFFIDGEKYGEPAYCYIRDGEQHRPGQSGDMLVRAYTSSLDAAVALVERVRPGWWWKIWSAHGEPAFACIRGDGTPEFRQAGTTPALALLAALLASLQEGQPHG